MGSREDIAEEAFRATTARLLGDWRWAARRPDARRVWARAGLTHTWLEHVVLRYDRPGRAICARCGLSSTVAVALEPRCAL